MIKFMVDTVKKLLIKYREVILYLIFGVLTTAVNMIIFFLLLNVLNIHYIISNVIAWIAAVLFAYVTNKSIVFQAKTENKKDKIREFISFIACRVFSLLIETVMLWLMVDIIDFNSNISKIITSIVVVIINYIGSKFFIFIKK